MASNSTSDASNDSQLVSYLKSEKCIVEGEFKLKNGEISNVYYDIKGIISNPELFRLVCDNLIRILPNNLINYSLIYGIPYGGLPIASYLSITNNKGLIYSRNKKKEYGKNFSYITFILGNVGCVGKSPKDNFIDDLSHCFD